MVIHNYLVFVNICEVSIFCRRSKYIKLLKTIIHAPQKPTNCIHEAFTQKDIVLLTEVMPKFKSVTSPQVTIDNVPAYW